MTYTERGNRMSIAEKMAQRVQELMAGGTDLQSALAKVLEETKVHKPRSSGGALARIRKSRNIPELRNIRKTAYAKISKSKDKPDACERYRKEIAAAEKKLTELLAEVSQSRCPWKKSMELGETAAGAFNYYLDELKARTDEVIGALRKRLTNAQVKAGYQSFEVEIPEGVPEVLRPTMEARIKNGDMQVITICRQLSFIKAVKAQSSAL